MKDDMRYVFDREGDFQFRAVFSTREGKERNRKVTTSDWMSVSVTSNSLSEEWRQEFKSRDTVLMPFSFSAGDDAIKYVGTGYYKTYSIYQGYGMVMLKMLSVDGDVGSLYEGIADQLRDSTVGGKMWTSFLNKEFSFKIDEVEDGHYYIVW